ncbi:hypothetical protein M0638_05795 [Roseomonas sp. NAR14]|uniref:UrcA family protein n=1 Tax=Roseomonas acroporae TaxID=2937791 RepID=A0A9X1Y661_9PROT|nr:hypothetical protein [Roseomonas acroporae]MCK8783893.1 hypothetical protein [Roseomonas acroporae]
MPPFRRVAMALGVAAAGLPLAVPMAPRADVPPPPGYRERAIASLIVAAGHACPEVTGLGAADPQDAARLAAQGLDAALATCSGGARYVVGTPRRRYGAPDPNAPPLPAPQVWPLR